MKTARFVRRIEEYVGDQRLYAIDPPVTETIADESRTYNHLLVSALHVGGRPETYIFSADPDGAALTLSELPGSQKDTLDHEAALRRAGYEIVG